MCTSARMIYTLTYRALREFASGRKSVNPIETLHQMETAVPFSVCGKTHRVMMLALRSFNQRVLKPAGVHEPLEYWPAKRLWKTLNHLAHWEGISLLSDLKTEVIHTKLHEARSRAYSRRAIGPCNHLRKLESTEWIIAHNLVLPPFTISLQV